MCKNCNMAHLHVHSMYSLLDGQSRISDIAARVIENKQNAIAITDHGALLGVVEFHRTMSAAGIKPILGMEGYLATRGLHDKDKDKDAKPYHILMLAKNAAGLKNLFRMSSIAQTDGFYHRPRIDKELLAKHHEGLILTSGCLASDINRALANHDEAQALSLINWYRSMLGDDFYLELQYREHSADQKRANEWLLDVSKKHGIKAIVTSDSHYTRRQDSTLHDTLLCIQTGARKDDEKRMRFDEDTYYLVDTPTMANAFPHNPELLFNTLEIAEKVEVYPLGAQGTYHLPDFYLPDGYSSRDFLLKLCDDGIAWRFGDNPDLYNPNHSVQERIRFEIDVISKMGFENYFLIVWDLVEYARSQNIYWNVRGSGAGSIVAYLLGITSIDPLEHGLFFERFLNPNRVSMPDIDLDFQDNRRGEMIRYAVDVYGDDRVAAIVTFGTMGEKTSIRDVGRVYGHPLSLVNTVTELIPNTQRDSNLQKWLDESEPLRHLYDGDPRVRHMYDIAQRLEGTIRHTGIHPAGVIISNVDVSTVVPIHRLTGDNFDGTGVRGATQFDMSLVEDFGLLKVDFLGLATLTAMQIASDEIYARHGIRWTVDNIPYRHDDGTLMARVAAVHKPDGSLFSATELNAMLDSAFALLSSGDTFGVFQVEGSGLTQMLTELRPTCLEHITAAISLYRPGPMGVDAHNSYIRRLHGKEEITYRHPLLEPVLKETLGLLIFQEDVMRVASQLFGYAPADADKIRKAVGKKQAAELRKHRETFVVNGSANGIDNATANAIFDDIEYFADYGFNKAHGTDYAKIAVQTAFLKTHYPQEYMTALLSVYIDKEDKLLNYIGLCKQYGFKITPPSFSNHTERFLLIGDRIVPPITLIKNVGSNVASDILSASYTLDSSPDSFVAFARATSLEKVSVRVLQHMILAGAFDEFFPDIDRYTLHANAQFIVDTLRGQSKKPNKKVAPASQQMMLFGGQEEDRNLANKSLWDTILSKLRSEQERSEYTPNWMLEQEKAVLGFYLSGHPMDKYAPVFEIGTHSVNDVEKHGGTYVIGGAVDRVHTIMDKRGKQMAFVTLSDWRTGSKIDLTYFSDTWKVFSPNVFEGGIVRVTGKCDTSRGKKSLLVSDTVLAETLVAQQKSMQGIAVSDKEKALLSIQSGQNQEQQENTKRRSLFKRR